MVTDFGFYYLYVNNSGIFTIVINEMIYLIREKRETSNYDDLTQHFTVFIQIHTIKQFEINIWYFDVKVVIEVHGTLMLLHKPSSICLSP